MWFLDQLAEQRIEQARDRGELSNLPGQGKPLPEEDMALVAQEERMAYRILKNAGYLPPELALHKEAVALAMQIATSSLDSAEAEQTLAPLLDRLARINLYLSENGLGQLSVLPEYLDKLGKLGN